MTSYCADDVCVRVASDLVFEERCCVGLSCNSTLTLHNPTNRWLHVALKLVAISVDGRVIDLSTSLPFVMKEKLIVEAQSEEEVRVIFAPPQAGAYIGQLNVIASPVVSDMPLQASRVPAVVTLQAIAEQPNVRVSHTRVYYTQMNTSSSPHLSVSLQIVTPDQSQLLDFGGLPYGSHKGVPVCIVNYSRARVPVRLSICSVGRSCLCLFVTHHETSGALAGQRPQLLHVRALQFR